VKIKKKKKKRKIQIAKRDGLEDVPRFRPGQTDEVKRVISGRPGSNMGVEGQLSLHVMSIMLESVVHHRHVLIYAKAGGLRSLRMLHY
jgi:hypothetical protein